MKIDSQGNSHTGFGLSTSPTFCNSKAQEGTQTPWDSVPETLLAFLQQILADTVLLALSPVAYLVAPLIFLSMLYVGHI